MQNILIWASNAFIFSSYLVYEWGIMKGKIKPHRTTRLVISIVVVLGFLAVVKQGNSAVAWFLGICVLQSNIVLLMSIKRGMGGWSKTDIVCLIIALSGIIFWKLTNNPALGLYASVAADLFAMIPTLIKTYRLPDTEFWLATVLDLLALICTMLAIQNGGFNEYLYPTYLIIVESLVLIFILVRPKQLLKSRQTF